MKFLAVMYTPHSGSGVSPSNLELPSFPQIITIERVLILLLFVVLCIPLLREQPIPNLESARIRLVKLSFLIGGMAAVLHFYRVLTGS